MDPSTIINKRVDVVCVFIKKGEQRDICRPVKMRLGEQEIHFTELGLRHPTTAGKRMIHVFDVSDGTNDYRLEFDAEALTWTLMAMLPGEYKSEYVRN